MRKILLALVMSLAVSLAACGPDSNGGGTDALVPEGGVLIDVRTPAEYAEGHLDGALNIDWNSPDFEAQISALDRDGAYVLYCRSGNRSGQAKAAMEQLGFTDVTNAGGYDDLR